MHYIKVAWKHDNIFEPIMLYSEVNDDGWEVRKVEFFPGGKIGYADSASHSLSTTLGLVRVPSLQVIAESPEFSPVEISRQEFEEVWRQAKA